MTKPNSLPQQVLVNKKEIEKMKNGETEFTQINLNGNIINEWPEGGESTTQEDIEAMDFNSLTLGGETKDKWPEETTPTSQEDIEAMNFNSLTLGEETKNEWPKESEYELTQRDKEFLDGAKELEISKGWEIKGNSDFALVSALGSYLNMNEESSQNKPSSITFEEFDIGGGNLVNGISFEEGVEVSIFNATINLDFTGALSTFKGTLYFVDPTYTDPNKYFPQSIDTTTQEVYSFTIEGIFVDTITSKKSYVMFIEGEEGQPDKNNLNGSFTLTTKELEYKVKTDLAYQTDVKNLQDQIDAINNSLKGIK